MNRAEEATEGGEDVRVRGRARHVGDPAQGRLRDPTASFAGGQGDPAAEAEAEARARRHLGLPLRLGSLLPLSQLVIRSIAPPLPAFSSRLRWPPVHKETLLSCTTLLSSFAPTLFNLDQS